MGAVVVKVFGVHGPDSPAVSEAALWAIKALAEKSAITRRLMGEADACTGGWAVGSLRLGCGRAAVIIDYLLLLFFAFIFFCRFISFELNV